MASEPSKAKAVKVQVGEMPCENSRCSSHDKQRPVYVFMKPDTKCLSYRCECCGWTPHALAGQPVRDDWITNMRENGTWTGDREQAEQGKGGALSALGF